MNNRRKAIKCLLGLGLALPIAACVQGKLGMQKDVMLDTVIFNYYDRPIFDVYLGNEMLGNAGSYGGGKAIMSAVKISKGSQNLKWRLDGPPSMARNGETVTAKNNIIIDINSIPKNAEYIGVHIYPDETTELTYSYRIPQATKKGESFINHRTKVKDYK